MRDLVERAALLVTALVERERHASGELASLLQHGIDGVRVHVGMLGQGLEFVGHLEHLVHDELHVAQRRRVEGHGLLLGLGM